MSDEELRALFKKVKKVAVEYVKVVPMMEYEIRWASKEPKNSGERRVLDKVVKGSGPLLIALFTD